MKKAISDLLGKIDPSLSFVKEKKPGVLLDISELQTYMEHFPIGGKLHYFPNQLTEMRLETIIIAYKINDTFVYNQSAIRITEDGVVIVGEKGERTVLGQIHKFFFVVPHSRRSVVSLSDKWWESDPKGGENPEINDFMYGNTITLFARYGSHGVPTLDTIVLKTVVLHDGMYQKTKVSLLEPEPDRFKLSDRRSDVRIETRFPVSLKITKDGPVLRAVMDEYSDGHARIVPLPGDEILSTLALGHKIVFAIEFPDDGRRFVMKSEVMKKVGPKLVVKIIGILANERFRQLDTLDNLELKAALTNFPAD